MPKIICTLPNASTSINGVAFAAHDLGMVSEEIERDHADAFLQINGYVDHAEAMASGSTQAEAVRPKITIKKK